MVSIWLGLSNFTIFFVRISWTIIIDFLIKFCSYTINHFSGCKKLLNESFLGNISTLKFFSCLSEAPSNFWYLIDIKDKYSPFLLQGSFDIGDSLFVLKKCAIQNKVLLLLQDI